MFCMYYGLTEGSHIHHLGTGEEVRCSKYILKEKYFVTVDQ
jgi:hypothetical protein